MFIDLYIFEKLLADPLEKKTKIELFQLTGISGLPGKIHFDNAIQKFKKGGLKFYTTAM